MSSARPCLPCRVTFASTLAALAGFAAELVAGTPLFTPAFDRQDAFSAVKPTEFVSGSLPRGWIDNSAWSKARVKHSFQTEGGVPFWRIEAESKGQVQVFSVLPAAPDGKSAVKYVIKARSAASIPVLVGIKRLDKPYNLLSFIQLQPGPEWKIFELYSKPCEAAAKVGCQISFDAPAGLDLALLSVETAEPPPGGVIPSAAMPISKLHEQGWANRHKTLCENVRKAKPDVLFLGDSITQNWETAGAAAWAAQIAPFNAANFGIIGDRIENLLWRVENSGLGAGFQPKAAVVLIGTNNLWLNTPEETAAGMKTLVDAIRKRSPRTKVLIVGLFPRSEKATDAIRAKVKETNELYAKLANGKDIRFVDIGPAFLGPDGNLTKDASPDFLHLSGKSYAVYASKLAAELPSLLGR